MSDLAGSRAGTLGRELGLVAGAILAYFAVRNLTAGSVDDAFANAAHVVRLERSLGLAWEGSAQTAVLGVHGALSVANWVYIWAHWPVILGTAAALYVWRRDRYYLLRNALFVSGAIGFLFFAFFPVAPPRLADVGLVDTVTRYSHAYRALQPPGLTNQYAAFPSLHAGWNLLVGIVLFGTSTRLLVRAFAVASPAAMFAAVVVTANHFVLDVAGGVAAVLVALAVARAVERRCATTLERRGRGAYVGRASPVRRRPSRRQPAGPPPRGDRVRRAARRG
jgi:hypothetical protein